MRQDRNEYFPKPRPRSGNVPQRNGNLPQRDFGPQRRQFRPAPPPARPKRPAQPAVIKPLEPASGKQRRQMLKAAAWRLAAVLRVRPSAVLAAEPAALPTLIRQAMARVDVRASRGDAMRLVAKIVRLRK
jgi:hypothetical protein